MARQQLGESGTEGVDIPGLCSKVISSVGATRTLKASESGSTCLFDSASGNVYTLPTAVAGLTFRFFQSVAVTSNASKIITASSSEFLLGMVMIGSQTVADSGDVFEGNGSTHVAISQDGATKGGLLGGWIEVVAISSTQWVVRGLLQGSGTVATPFATS